jgi:tRNA(Ile)-lysidine synthase
LPLLLGHHAADQAETLMIRVVSGSGARGLGGMAGVTETGTVRILRPLVTVPPSWLRFYLIDAGAAWVEDPSNLDRQAQRVRLRLLRNDTGGEGEGTQTLGRAARDAGLRRTASDIASAAALASRVTIYPEGFALLSPGPISPEVLAELLRTIGGAVFAPSIDQVAPVAANPMACTIGGVRLLPARRLGDGWLLVREEVAAASSVPALDGAVWDGRFRLNAPQALPVGTLLGAVGDAAVRIREHTDLPAAVLRVMPAIWRCNTLLAVPQLLYCDPIACELGCRLVFDPRHPLAGAPFCPA